MTNNIAKIRAGLQPYVTDMDKDEALAALAELERAAKEPVAYCNGDNLDIGIPLRFQAFTRPQPFADTPLYTTPPPAQPAPGMPTEAELKDVIREGALVTNGDAWTIAERVFKFIQERTK